MYRDGSIHNYVITKLGTAITQLDLLTIESEICELYSIDNVAYLAICLPRADRHIPIVMSTYDPGWEKQYRRREFHLIDPVIQQGGVAFAPLDWDNFDKSAARSQDFFSQADRFGVGRHGLSVPIQNYLGERALFTFTSNVNEGQWALFRRQREAELSFIGRAFHERAVEISGYRDMPAKTAMGRQEQRCLQFLAVGHSPKEIAHILNISTSTVRMHLRNAKKRLGSKTLTQAVAESVHLGIVTY